MPGEEPGEPCVDRCRPSHELLPALVVAGAVEGEEDELRRPLARLERGIGTLLGRGDVGTGNRAVVVGTVATVVDGRQVTSSASRRHRPAVDGPASSPTTRHAVTATRAATVSRVIVSRSP